MHQIKRILALTIAALMALSACAFAEEEDLAAQLEAANARIAELEAQIETYTVAAKYDGGVVSVEEVEEQYAYLVNMYAQYGYDISSYADYYVEDIIRQIVAVAKSGGAGPGSVHGGRRSRFCRAGASGIR